MEKFTRFRKLAKRRIGGIMAVLMVLAAIAGPVIRIPSAIAALGSVSPVDPSNGFPFYYKDNAGTALVPCLAGAGGIADPNCVVLADATFNPANPIVFPTNFPGEFFYYIADSDQLSVGPGLAGRANFRMALEGTFLSPAPETGQQLTFLRINLQKISGLQPNSAYTVTYPFGTFTFHTDAAGNTIGEGNAGGGGTAFRNEDPQAPGPGAFDALLPAPATNISTFLGAVAPAPPAGYLGNPAILQTIQAGPNGAILKIDGPNIGGTGVNTIQTNFWSVAGKIAPAPTLSAISVTPPSATVQTGNSLQLTASAFDQFGVPMAPQPAFAWLSSNPTIGTVDAAGLFTGSSAGGPINVSASVGAVSGNSIITVSSVPQTLTSITVSPPTATVTNGLTKQFTATAIDQFGNPMAPQPVFAWSSSDPVIGSIDAAGLFTGITPGGPITITALSGAVSGTAGVTVTAGLKAAGIADPVNGFPISYTDAGNLSLVPCLAGANGLADPNCILAADASFNPAQAVSFPGNFPGEFFYYIADSEPLTVGPGGSGRARLRMALEGTFFTGTPVAGQQMTFVRINLSQFAAGDLSPNSTYTVTYPFGSFQFSTDGTGSSLGAQAFRTEDGCATAPCDFTALLPVPTTHMTNFLAWNPAVGPAAPAGYIGDPGILHQITNGPNGNFLKIDGPNIGGAGVNTIQTALWSVAGKTTGAVPPAPVLSSISVTPVSAVLAVGATQQFTAAAFDQFGAPLAPQPVFVWNSSNPAAGSIDATGLFTAASAGLSNVSASVGGVNSNLAAVTVNPPVAPVLTTIAITPPSATVNVGSRLQFSAQGLDQFGSPIAAPITWSSSDTRLGPINNRGLFSALRIGNVTVNAASGNITASSPVIIVGKPELAAIIISPAGATVPVGGTQQFSLTALDQFGNPIAANINWKSSNTRVGRIGTNTGLFTARSAGTTTITAGRGRISASITVTVQ